MGLDFAAVFKPKKTEGELVGLLVLPNVNLKETKEKTKNLLCAEINYFDNMVAKNIYIFIYFILFNYYMFAQVFFSV